MKERRRLALVLRALITCAALAGIGTATAAAEKRVQFNIAPQGLLTALNQFARQSDQELLFSTDVATSKRTSGVTGEFAPTEALRALLEGTGLEYRVTSENTILIERTGEGVSDRRAETTSSVFRTPLVLAQATLPSQGAQPESTKSNERSSPTASEEREAERLGEMTVTTGTHIPGAATASPLFVFDQTDFDRAGAVTVEQFLATVPQNFGGTKSDDTVTRDVGLNPSFGTAVNLRGLGGSATLVLVNGHRSAAASGAADFVDVSMIPLSAVERIEILTDGASAIYGSDAIGGVINFIMRKDYEGGETRLRGGATTQGGGTEYQAQQSWGANWGSGGALLSYEHYSREAVISSDRDFSADTFPDNGNGPFDLVPKQKRNSIYLSAQQELSDRLELSASLLYADRDANWVSWEPFALVLEETTADTQQYGGSAGLAFALSDSWRVEVDAQISRNDTDNIQGSPSQPIVGWSSEYELWSTDAKLTGDLFRLPAGLTKFATGASYRDESYLFTDGFSLPPEDSFSIRAAFAEFVVPIVGGSDVRPEIERLTLTLAGRYEEHSSFGTTFDPKFGLRWAVSEALSLRGTYGTSFKAPSLYQLNEFSGRNTLANRPDPRSPDGSGLSRTISRLGNNPDLQEETATTWTIGADLTPKFAAGLTINLTYFDVEYKDRIEQTVAFPNLLLSDPSYELLVTRRGDMPDSEFNALVAQLLSGRLPVAGCAFPLDPTTRACPEPTTAVNAILERRLFNLAGTQTSGVDLTTNQQFDSRSGAFDLSLNASYLVDFERQITPSFPAVEFVDTVGNPVDLRLRASATWSRNGWGVTTTVNYADGYTDQISSPMAGVASWATIDFNVRYDTADRFSSGWLDDAVLSLAVLNVLDKDPPFIADPFWGIGYDPSNADPLGRVVSLTLGKHW